MKTRLASLFLVLMLAGSVFAGVPQDLSQGECGMDEMMGMDCCKAALMQKVTPQVADAKLCCALYCTQNGTTSPPSGIRLTPASPVLPPTHPAITAALRQPGLVFHRIDRIHGPPDSGPAYLRNLALLI